MYRHSRGASTIIVVGLSRDNVKRLVAGDSILLQRERHGPILPEGLEIVLTFGTTEEDIAERLRRIGAIDDSTPVYLTAAFARDLAQPLGHHFIYDVLGPIPSGARCTRHGCGRLESEHKERPAPARAGKES